MKNFTLLLVMFLISFGLSAKNSSDLQKKIQQNQEKFSVITKLNSRLNSLAKLHGSEVKIKSAAATQKLDSSVNRVLNPETQLWQNDYKDEYLYDAEMRNTVSINKEWNTDSNSWDISKTELGYDNNDRINSMLMYESDELTQVLKKVSKFLIFYNSEGMQDSLSMYSSEDDGATWVLDMNQINHYNEAKQLIKTDFWVLDEDLGELILSMNIVNIYTASGKIDTLSVMVVEEGDEMLMSITDYNYDGSEKLTSIEYSTINIFTTGAMEKSSRTAYQYNASGDRTAEINSKWNGTSWVDEDKTEYTYNAAGDVSVEIGSTWNGTAWEEKWKDEYTFSTTNFSDVAFPQVDFIMDIFSSFLSFMGLQESFDFSYNKLITGVNSFEKLNGTWKNTEKTVFFYSGGTSTNITEFENSVVNVYPNPASESVNFSWKGNHEALSLQIFQITGAKVTEQTVYSGRPVSISHLENGVYLYKLLNGQQNVKTGKMIKR